MKIFNQPRSDNINHDLLKRLAVYLKNDPSGELAILHLEQAIEDKSVHPAHEDWYFIEADQMVYAREGEDSWHRCSKDCTVK